MIYFFFVLKHSHCVRLICTNNQPRECLIAEYYIYISMFKRDNLRCNLKRNQSLDGYCRRRRAINSSSNYRKQISFLQVTINNI